MDLHTCLRSPVANRTLDKAWAPFPTYPVILGFKGTTQDVVDFRQLMAGGKQVPGLPKLNPDRVVS